MLQPNVSPMGRYSTNKTCELLGIGRSTLNRWRKRGLIRPRYTKVNFRPYYIGHEILSLWTNSLL